MAASPINVIPTYNGVVVSSSCLLYEASPGPGGYILGDEISFTLNGDRMVTTIKQDEVFIYIKYEGGYYLNRCDRGDNNIELTSITPYVPVEPIPSEPEYIDEVNFGNGYQPLHDKRIPGIDTTPTSGSDNVVTSGGIYSAVSAKYTKPSGGIPASDIASGVIPSAPGSLVTNATTAQTTSSGEAMSGTITLHKIAKTGTYSDLIGTPTIPSTLDDISDGTNRKLANYLPLSGGTMTGAITMPTSTSATDTTKGINFSNGSVNVSHIGTSTLMGLYSDGKIVLRPNGAQASSTGNGSVEIDNSGISISEIVTAEGFKKSGGTSSQFLKADGSVDSNTYALSSAIPTVNDSTITVQMNGSTVDSFTTNASSNKTINLGTVLTSHQDISGKEDITNKITTISASSTDTQYPSAKCIYDRISTPFIASKEQEGFASSSTYSVHCLLTFKPNDWDKMYTIRFKIQGWVESETDVESVSDITLQCFQGVVKSYYIQNAIANTSKLAYYNLYYYGLTNSGYTAGAESIIGPYVNSANCWSYTTKRKFKVDLIWTDGCTATLIDDCNSSVAKTGFASSCYLDSVKYNTYTAGLQETGDSNTTYSIISDSELRTGTATSSRTISAARLKANYSITTDSTTGVKTLRIADQTMTPEDITNKVTSLSSSSTDTEYPSAKAVYDELANKYIKPSTGIPASDLSSDIKLPFVVTWGVSSQSTLTEMLAAVSAERPVFCHELGEVTPDNYMPLANIAYSNGSISVVTFKSATRWATYTVSSDDWERGDNQGNAVQYVEQSLTDAQKTQARLNQGLYATESQYHPATLTWDGDITGETPIGGGGFEFYRVGDCPQDLPYTALSVTVHNDINLYKNSISWNEVTVDSGRLIFGTLTVAADTYYILIAENVSDANSNPEYDGADGIYVTKYEDDTSYIDSIVFDSYTLVHKIGIEYLPTANNASTGTVALSSDIPEISTDINYDKLDNAKTISPAAAYSEIHPLVGTSRPSGGFLPNKLYRLGTLTGTITFSLASPSDSYVMNHYFWTFETGSTVPTITWPSGLSWFGGSAPTINSDCHYEISVLDNIAVAMEV